MKGRDFNMQIAGVKSKRMLLFHTPTVLKLIHMFGLSFLLRTSLQKKQNRSNPHWEVGGGYMKESSEVEAR